MGSTEEDYDVTKWMMILTAGLGLSLLGLQPSQARIWCNVADPTGTPLNVRSSPNGPIMGALHNGVTVHVNDLVVHGAS